MNSTYTEYTLTITPSVGAPIIFTGDAGYFELQKILVRSDVVSTTDLLTGEIRGTYSLGGCCTEFSAIPAQVPVAVTVDEIPCLI